MLLEVQQTKPLDGPLPVVLLLLLVGLASLAFDSDSGLSFSHSSLVLAVYVWCPTQHDLKWETANA